jgi:hypothetical protein
MGLPWAGQRGMKIIEMKNMEVVFAGEEPLFSAAT